MNLQSYLKIKKITITELAYIAGLSKACIHNIVTRKRIKITAETAVKIQLATENCVKVVDLIGRPFIRKLADKIDRRIKRSKRRNTDEYLK